MYFFTLNTNINVKNVIITTIKSDKQFNYLKNCKTITIGVMKKCFK